MGKFNDFRSRIADDLEIPNDALSDNFNLMMHGNKKVIIENHLGIIVYENNLIEVKAIEVNIIVKGAKFKIEEINDYKVIVKGNIEEIIFKKE
ncbi:YabP/YqfC family sporulation protein [Sedimentibacter sp.]|uniref:YabP/YqfC family sporulation protein n=1 Tax=Sedimentibacter sp. TaxID=1960295 RepID=UPI0028AB9325|nr:YabP/YqfC family sporulation protein [Sedimentibacter sp.]